MTEPTDAVMFPREAQIDTGWTIDYGFIHRISDRTREMEWTVGMEETECVLLAVEAELSGARPMPETPEPNEVAPKLGEQCMHGQLKRQCLACELEGEVTRITRDNSNLRAEVARLKNGLRSIVGLCDEWSGVADAQVMAGRILNEQPAGGRCELCERDTRKAENTALAARNADLERENAALGGLVRQLCAEDECGCHCPSGWGGGECGQCKAAGLPNIAPGKEPTDAE